HPPLHDRVRDGGSAGVELEIATWVADFRRERSRREYEVRLPGEPAPVLTANADWVYVDALSGRPLPRRALEIPAPPADASTLGPAVRGRRRRPSRPREKCQVLRIHRSGTARHDRKRRVCPTPRSRIPRRSPRRRAPALPDLAASYRRGGH